MQIEAGVQNQMSYFRLKTSFSKVLPVCTNDIIKNFIAAIGNIYAQFAPVNRGLISAYIALNQLFRKYFRYARMTSLKFSKFNFSAA